MKRTVSLKLDPSPEQAQALSEVQGEFAKACNQIVPLARDHRCWNRAALHHMAYYPTREQTRLGSQMVCNAVKAVADAYKVLQLKRSDTVPTLAFRPSGSVHYDARTFRLMDGAVSLYSLRGRVVVPIKPGDFQQAYLDQGKVKEAELLCRRRTWFLNITLDLPDAPAATGGGVVGVDVGENNLAALSLGKLFGGDALRHSRDRSLALRRRLQSNGSRAARRKLKAISGREARRIQHVNHETSKAIVASAVQAGAARLVLEDLTDIRARIKAGKRVRARLHGWAFRQLQTFVEYKAQAAGLEVVYVNPAYTSQTCASCGLLGLRQKHRFSCSHCGRLAHSDANAALNLARLAPLFSDARADVTRPYFTHPVSQSAVESPSL